MGNFGRAAHLPGVEQAERGVRAEEHRNHAVKVDKAVAATKETARPGAKLRRASSAGGFKEVP